MSVGGRFRGISSDQDMRFEDKTKSLLQAAKFPSLYNEVINMRKIVLESVKPWIESQVETILGLEDEVLSEYIASMLEEEEGPNPRTIHINLIPFFNDATEVFMKKLWKLLISAQNNASGVPTELENSKAEEIEKEVAERERISRKLRVRREKVEREASDRVEVRGRKPDRERTSPQRGLSQSSGESDGEKRGDADEPRTRRSRSRSEERGHRRSRHHDMRRHRHSRSERDHEGDYHRRHKHHRKRRHRSRDDRRSKRRRSHS